MLRSIPALDKRSINLFIRKPNRKSDRKPTSGEATKMQLTFRSMHTSIIALVMSSDFT